MTSDPRTSMRHRPGLAGLRARRGWELHPGVRSDRHLSRGEWMSDLLRDRLGSWPFTVAAAGLVIVGVVAAVRRDDGAGPVAALTTRVSAQLRASSPRRGATEGDG